MLELKNSSLVHVDLSSPRVMFATITDDDWKSYKSLVKRIADYCDITDPEKFKHELWRIDGKLFNRFDQIKDTLQAVVQKVLHCYPVLRFKHRNNLEPLSPTFIEETLVANFGANLARRTLTRYGSLPNPTMLDLKKLLINTAAYVRREDLEELFNTLRNGHGPQCNILSGLTKEEKQAICGATTFDELPFEQHRLLLKLYRSKLQHLIDAPLSKGVKNNAPAWEQNAAMLASFNYFPGYISKSLAGNAKWGSLEYISRAISSHLPNPACVPVDEIVGTLVPIFDFNLNCNYFEIKGVMCEQSLALYVLTPMSKDPYRESANAEYPVIVLFRDLEDRKLPFTPWETDLRAGLFVKGENKILHCIANCLPKDKDFTLICLGYSLASIDAQLLVANLVQGRADEWMVLNNPETPSFINDVAGFEKMKRLMLGVWDPEVISSAINAKYTTSRKDLQNSTLPLEVKKYFAFCAKPFYPPYHGDWLGLQDADTEAAEIYLIDTRSSYGPELPDPRFTLVQTHTSGVIPLEREQLVQQRGMLWQVMKAPTAISRTFHNNVLPSVASSAESTATMTRRLFNEHPILPENMLRLLKLTLANYWRGNPSP